MGFAPTTPATGIIDGTVGVLTDGVLYGAPPSINVVGIDLGEVPDNGGVKVTATGVFSLTETVTVTVVDPASGLERVCYSGRIGEGNSALSLTGTTLTFVVPPFPIGGPYDLEFAPATSIGVTLSGALTYVHRTYATNLFQLRALIPPPRYVGPYSIEDED